MSFTWVMEPPRWETEESECILIPGMPLVMLPPWTAEIEAGKKITMKISNVCCDGNMYDCYILLPITVITENRFKRSNNNQQLHLWLMSTLHLPTLHTRIWDFFPPIPPLEAVRSDELQWTRLHDFKKSFKSHLHYLSRFSGLPSFEVWNKPGKREPRVCYAGYRHRNVKGGNGNHLPRPVALSWDACCVDILSAWDDKLWGDNCSCFMTGNGPVVQAMERQKVGQ